MAIPSNNPPCLTSSTSSASSSSNSSPCSSSTSSAPCDTQQLHFAPRRYPVSIHRRRINRRRRFKRLPFAIREQQRQLKSAESEAADMLVEIEYEANWKSQGSKRRRLPASWDEWVLMACRIYSPINDVLVPQELIDKMAEIVQLRMSISARFVRGRPGQVESNRSHLFFAYQMQVVLVILTAAPKKHELLSEVYGEEH